MILYEINELWETILYNCFLSLINDEHQLYHYCRNLSLCDSKSNQIIFNLMLRHSNFINHGLQYRKIRRAICNIYGNLKPYHGEQKQIKVIGYDVRTNKLYFRVSPRSYGYRLVLLVNGTMKKPTILYTICEYVSLEKEYWSLQCRIGGACWRTIEIFKVYPVIIHSGIKIVQEGRFKYLDNYDNITFSGLKISLPFPTLKKSFTKSGIINVSNLN